MITLSCRKFIASENGGMLLPLPQTNQVKNLYSEKWLIFSV